MKTKTIHILLGAACFIGVACSGSGDQSSMQSQLTSADGGDAGDAGANALKIIQVVERSDIVSNQSGAKARDEQLQNAWGLAFSSLGTAWVSAAETGVSGVYDPDGKHVLPNVVIPPPANGEAPSHPTGQVFNSQSDAFFGDAFIFVTEDGVVAGWQPGQGSAPSTRAMLRVDNSASKAIYKGLGIAMHAASGGPRLYAANFWAGTIDVFDMAYNHINTSGKFIDEQLPEGFAPFNVQEIKGLLYVTYAKQNEEKDEDVAGAGNGFVNVFDPDGTLVSRLIQRGTLDSPWGITVAPSGFGSIANRLLVGNFGDGTIHVYELTKAGDGSTDGGATDDGGGSTDGGGASTDGGDGGSGVLSVTAKHEGVLGDEDGKPMVIDGLWALQFGGDKGGFSSTDLYFTAGPNEEKDGVFGELEVEGEEEEDAGAADAGEADAGGGDAGTADAGGGDAGTADAGGGDAGTTDAGEADAGAADAGEADAGAGDAGSADAGVPAMW